MYEIICRWTGIHCKTKRFLQYQFANDTSNPSSGVLCHRFGLPLHQRGHGFGFDTDWFGGFKQLCAVQTVQGVHGLHKGVGGGCGIVRGGLVIVSGGRGRRGEHISEKGVKHALKQVSTQFFIGSFVAKFQFALFATVGGRHGVRQMDVGEGQGGPFLLEMTKRKALGGVGAVLHRARCGEETGEIVVETVQDGGGWLRHLLSG